jgi:nucleotide-binding universal stress UspA family protein
MTEIEGNLSSAIEDFRRARSKAAMKQILARFTGEPVNLLSFEEARQKLKMQGITERGLQEIPLDSIIGSVGRYSDFTRDFLPLASTARYRWASVKLAIESAAGLPPIQVYQIGDAYFVQDGNHRVSVARQLGFNVIQAQVTEIRTRVGLTANAHPDELIIKAEYAEFLEATGFDHIYPGVDLSVSVPGKYEVLQEQIAFHRYDMSLEAGSSIPLSKAVAGWYEDIYLPVVNLIREQGILRYFPGRTETDMYLWIWEHQEELGREYGLEIRPAAAASSLVNRFRPGRGRALTRLGGKLLDKLGIHHLETGPTPGQWRLERFQDPSPGRMFGDILVTIKSGKDDWNAMEQALIVARREGARLLGLHVVPSRKGKESDEAAREIQTKFAERCSQAGISGHLVVTEGKATDQICARLNWADLLVIGIIHPQAPRRLVKLSANLRELMRRSSRPILVAPSSPAPLEKAMLCYDGSPKSEEAMFIAAYLAGRWEIPLVVLHATENDESDGAGLERARSYLGSSGIEATFLEERGPVVPSILIACEQYHCDFLIMGGYGQKPIAGVVLGSAVDEVLRTSRRPVFICR